MTSVRDAIRRILPLLEHRQFLKLWISQLLTQPASHVLNFVLAVRIFQLTGSNAWVGALVALVSVPPILFSSTAGVMADRFNRRWILILSNLIRAAIAIGFFFLGDSALALLAIGFLISTLNQFFGPAETASIPTLVPVGHILVANSLFVFTVYGSFLLGYSVAGPLLTALGDARTFALLVALFTLAAYFDVLLPRLADHLSPGARAVLNARAVRHAIRDALLFIRSKRVIWVVVLELAVVFGVERSLIALMPGFADLVLGLSVSDISVFLITPVAVGALLAALAANRLRRWVTKRHLITLGILLAGVTLIGFPFYAGLGTPDLTVRQDTVKLRYIMALAVLTGFADVLIIIAAQTILHEETPPNTRGRVFGSLITLMNVVGLPMILISSFLANHISIPTVMTGLGVFTVLFGVLALVEERLVPGRLP
jgi:MFS family permease